jgi:type IV pilus assembly protein PilM
MAVNPGVWGIDVGQCALKALRLELINGVVTATAFEYVEHPKILSQPDANPDELTREALEKFLERNPTKGDVVAMSVPGQSGLARFVKLPPVEEKKISDIVKFEAKQQIPFPLEEVVWDYQKVSEGTVTDGFAMDTEIGLFAMKRDMINRFIGHFQAVKLEVHHVQMAPLALANFVTYDLLKRGGIDGEAAPPPTIGKKKCVVALDIGTDGSNLIITDGARIIWQRPIPVGGNHFTRALTKELKLTFAKAEHLKRNAAKSPELANILKALRPVLQEFVGEVQRSLGYFTNTHRDAQVEYMVGLGSAFKLPGLQKFLADKLSLDVRKVDKLHRVSGEAVLDAPVFKENLLSFPVAYGLALQSLGVARLNTNLLPPEITFERKIRAKKPYAVASAAALLFGTTVLAYGYSVPLSDVNDARIKTSYEKAKTVAQAAQSNDQAITAKKADIEKTGLDVKSIIAGQAERENWIELNRYVNECLPVPGPVPGPNNTPGKAGPEHNMNEVGLLPYWNTPDGWAAIKKYDQRRGKGLDPLESLNDDDKREFLAMLDIEAVYARHTKNLKQVYTNIEQKFQAEIGDPARSFRGSDMAPAQWWEAKPDRPMTNSGPEGVREELKPDGEGWVVEVRGYTYWDPTNRGAQPVNNFVMNTLVRNLIIKGQLPTGEDKEKSTAPIKGKVSHAFVYNTWKDPNPGTGTFQKIGNSLIDSMIPAPGAESGETGGVGGGIGGGMPMPGGPGSSASGPRAGEGGFGGVGGAGGNGWVPLNGVAGAGGMGGMGMGGMGMGGMGGFNPRSSSGSVPTPGVGVPPPIGPMPGGPMPGTPATGAATGVKVKPRYEFVVVFVWKELTPSDKLRPITPKPAAAAGGAGGYGAPVGPGTAAPPSSPPAGTGEGGLGVRGGIDP